MFNLFQQSTHEISDKESYTSVPEQQATTLIQVTQGITIKPHSMATEPCLIPSNIQETINRIINHFPSGECSGQSEYLQQVSQNIPKRHATNGGTCRAQYQNLRNKALQKSSINVDTDQITNGDIARATSRFAKNCLNFQSTISMKTQANSAKCEVLMLIQ
jgi:hypothetical protein